MRRLGAAVLAVASVSLPASALAATPRFAAALHGAAHVTAAKPTLLTFAVTLPAGDRLSSYLLDFGDHSKPARGSRLPKAVAHAYPAAGRYVATLTLTDRARHKAVAKLTERVAGIPAAAAVPVTPAPMVAAAGCNGPATAGVNAYDTTPAGAGPWTVPLDPCNTEAVNGSYYGNCAYWAAEKRPDIWVNAVWPDGYSAPPQGGFDVEEDAAKAGYPIDHMPQPGDVAAWDSGATMGSTPRGTETASPGGHVAYVEKVNTDGTIVISQMGADTATGGYTDTLAFDATTTYFIHQR